ncbi:MAG TPA: aldo/keto reductase [bacterium]|nr:aldo/keto reductase [bacterium]
MRYRWLGNTGLRVSEIGFGAWAIGGKWWGPQDDMDSRLALHKALDMGCTFIDTAWVYGDGHSEKLIGSVLKERGERPVIATKVPPQNWNWDNPPGIPLSDTFSPSWVVSKAEESMRNLGVDCLDVLQMHTWHQEWNQQAEPLLQAVARLKRDGKIRAFGISLRDKGPEEANDLIRWRQVDSLQIFFNLFYQDPIWKVFPLARQYGVGVIARVPLAFGALSGRFTPRTRFYGDDHRRNLYTGDGLKATLSKVEKLKFLSSKSMPLSEAAIKWTLSYPAVSTSIPGIRNLNQATVNCAAGDGEKVSASAARKSEKLYGANFGLPVKSLPSDGGVPAVFMSGIRLAPPLKKKSKIIRPQKARAHKPVKSRKAVKKNRPKKKKK